MTILQMLIFSIVQAITELFPVSSVAHAVLTPFIFNWHFDPTFLKEHFLPFVVSLHLGTAVALLMFFWREWLELLTSVFVAKAADARRTLMMIVVATLPAMVIGLVFEKMLRGIFSSVLSAAIFLIVNGFVLLLSERISKRGEKEIKDLSIVQAVAIGVAQSAALVPGFSRSGMSIVTGLLVGLKQEAAARFSMLLATPIIIGASLLEIPKLLRADAGPDLLQSALVGGITSGVFAYITVWLLMKLFKRHEINVMRPFVYYCWLVGAIVLLTIEVGKSLIG